MPAFRAGFGKRQIPHRVLAVRVTRARIEYLTVARFALEHGTFATLGTNDAGVLGFLQRFHVIAVGITAAPDKLAITPALYYQVGTAFWTGAALDNLRLAAATLLISYNFV